MLPRNTPPCAAYGVTVKQVGFRARLFLILLAFALIPTIVLAAAWELTVVRALPLLGTTPAMERIAGTGARAMAAARTSALTPEQRRALDEHQQALDEGLLRGRQMEFLMTRRAPVAAALAALAGGAALVARRLRRRALPAPAPALARAAPTAEPLSAYAAAVERLAAIEREGLPARERTTAALARALPRRLAEGGLRQRCRAVLGSADLVKFARVRPGEAQAAAFLAAARDLLDRWQHASHPAPAPPPGETPGAVLDEPRPADALR